MKFDVTVGEVAIRNVVMREHGQGILSVVIATPLEKHPIAHLGQTVGSRLAPVSTIVDVFRGAGAGRSDFNPSRVVITPESNYETGALRGGLFEIEWSNYGVTLVSFPFELFRGGGVVASWERYERGKVEYLGSL